MCSKQQFQVIQGGRKTAPASSGRLMLIDGLEAITREAVDRLIAIEIDSFADSLAAARAVYRDFPEMVTAPDFPEFLTALNGGSAPDCTYSGVPVITDEALEEIQAEARRIAPTWRDRRIQELRKEAS